MKHGELNEVMITLRDGKSAAGPILDGLFAAGGETLIGVIEGTGIKGLELVRLHNYCAERNRKLSDLFMNHQASDALAALESSEAQQT